MCLRYARESRVPTGFSGDSAARGSLPPAAKSLTERSIWRRRRQE